MIATVVLTLRIAMAIALFSFLGWALLTLWRDLKQQANSLATSKIPTINLEVVSGQDESIQSRFIESAITIGRDKNCDLALADDKISARHAHILYHHGQWWLEDLHSTNGTFLNREKILIPTVLTTGDEFQCGDTRFRVRIGFDGTSASHSGITQENDHG
jgi:pSer/pThr/pTyr-binding forkhead associated (FHA) protein